MPCFARTLMPVSRAITVGFGKLTKVIDIKVQILSLFQSSQMCEERSYDFPACYSKQVPAILTGFCSSTLPPVR
jgi:hypothetical protein